MWVRAPSRSQLSPALINWDVPVECMDINMPRKNLIHIKRDIQIKPASRGTCGYQKPAIKGDTQSTKQKTSKRESPRNSTKVTRNLQKWHSPPTKQTFISKRMGLPRKNSQKRQITHNRKRPTKETCIQKRMCIPKNSYQKRSTKHNQNRPTKYNQKRTTEQICKHRSTEQTQRTDKIGIWGGYGQ